jgi:hypothetical protein
VAYRTRIGEPGALSVAQSLAAQIDNPALDGLLETAWLSIPATDVGGHANVPAPAGSVGVARWRSQQRGDAHGLGRSPGKV